MNNKPINVYKGIKDKYLMNKFILVILLVLIIIPFTSATDQKELPYPVEKGMCAELIQTCANCTFINMTGVIYPNSTIEYFNVEMTQNINVYNASFCKTDSLGIYTYSTLGNPDGIMVTQNVIFEVTPSGAKPLDAGQSPLLLGALIIIFCLSILLFVLGYKVNNTVAKASFITFGCIMLLITILYTLLILNEAVATSPSLVEGYETFYTVMKTLATVGIVVFFVFIFLVFLKAWKIKRGLID